jgi:exoribonuclease R
MTYQIFIKNRSYSDWDFKDVNNENLIDTDSIESLKTLDPLKEKLFSRDILTFDSSNNLSIRKSIVRGYQTIAGVLILEGNRTYGRTSNKKKLLYKCVPDDRYLPAFLVPYEIKIGFSKNIKNKYVIFKFQDWDNKHPTGVLINTLGDVDNLEVFYEYQLYCKSLYVSFTEFVAKTKTVLNKIPHEEFIDQIFTNPNYNIEDRRSKKIITIDPENSVDFDDGFGIEPYLKNNEQIGWRVSIYIANVFLWLETLDLWKTFSHRVATIYLPDRKRPMLPTVLSDTLCSLQENQNRFALAMDIYIDMEGNFLEDIEAVKYRNVLIKVSKNYSYEEHKLLFNEAVYIKLYDLTCRMDRNVKTSHDIVSHWMILMNAYTGMFMLNKKKGIFRSVIIQNMEKDEDKLQTAELSRETKRVIKQWNNVSGHYINFQEDAIVNHELINMDSLQAIKKSMKKCNMKPYIHITSPIRRLVDLLNQIILYNEESYIVNSVSEKAKEFLNEWISKLDYVNTAMRSIRKVQTDCNLLHNCVKNPIYLENEHDGVVFDKVRRNNGAYNYMVYLEKLRLISRITMHHDIEEHTRNKFKLYMFQDEENLKKKIKLQLIVSS